MADAETPVRRRRPLRTLPGIVAERWGTRTVPTLPYTSPGAEVERASAGHRAQELFR